MVGCVIEQQQSWRCSRCSISLLAFAGPALNDNQIRQHTIQQSVAAYLGDQPSLRLPLQLDTEGLALRRAQRVHQTTRCETDLLPIRCD